MTFAEQSQTKPTLMKPSVDTTPTAADSIEDVLDEFGEDEEGIKKAGYDLASEEELSEGRPDSKTAQHGDAAGH